MHISEKSTPIRGSQSTKSYQSLNSFTSPASLNDNLSEKEKWQRERKKKILELNHEDSQKTALKKRSNKIFNNYLKEIDSTLYYHIQEIDVQPELIFLKWLRCLLSREFTLQSLLLVWDYILSGIDESGRHYLQKLNETTNVETPYHNDEYFLSHNDFLNHLDYVCLAMV